MKKKKLGDITIILVGLEETDKIARYGLFGKIKFNVKCYINWMTTRFISLLFPRNTIIMPCILMHPIRVEIDPSDRTQLQITVASSDPLMTFE